MSETTQVKVPKAPKTAPQKSAEAVKPAAGSTESNVPGVVKTATGALVWRG